MKHKLSGKRKMRAFVRGAGSLVNILHPQPSVEVLMLNCMDDVDALRSDWEAIGDDMREAIIAFRKKQQDESEQQRSSAG